MMAEFQIYFFFQVVAIKERVNTNPTACPLKITTKYLCNSVFYHFLKIFGLSDLDSQYGFIGARPFSDHRHAVLFEGNQSVMKGDSDSL